MTTTRSISGVRARRRPLALGLAVALAGALPTFVSAAPLDPPSAPSPSVAVSNCDDSGPGSLRDVMMNAEDGSSIDLSELTCSTITLTSGAIVTGQANGLTVMGPGADFLTIDGSASPGSALFYHLGGGKLWLQNVTIENGSKYRSDAAVRGGCVHAEDSVVLVSTVVRGCSANATGNFAALGGAVFSGGTTYALYSTISGNSAIAHGNGYASGGAIYASGDLVIEGTTVSDNDVRSYSSTPTFGGGALTRGATTIYDSAIVRNHAGRMGGLALASFGGDQYILNSTISENSADYMGGVYSRLPLLLSNSTIASNTTTRGSDNSSRVFGAGVHMGGAVALTAYSSLIAYNTTFGQYGYDVAGEAGATVAGSNNLVMRSRLTLPADTLLDAPVLARVADNGGRTPTQALMRGSPGTDAGTQPPGAPLDFDQRGSDFGRWFGGGPDIGAYENQADRILTSGLDFGPVSPPSPGTFPAFETFDELGGFVPALPSGWRNVASGVSGGWSTVSSGAYSWPFAAFANDVEDVSDVSLETSAFVAPENARLSFVHHFKLEVNSDVEGYDGAVLEIAIDGGAFEDIVAAGGTFIGGGYNRTIDDCCENPLVGRQVWSGDSDGYHTVVVDLPPAASGHSVRLRWRVGTDDSARDEGYWLDDIDLEGGIN